MKISIRSLVILTMTLICTTAPQAFSQTWIDKQDPSPGMEIRNDNIDVNFRSSDHFRLRWGKNNISGITVDEEFVQLNLQHAERHWQIMHGAFDPSNPLTSAGLGFPSPSIKWSGDDGYRYRANWRLGQTFGADDGGAGGAVDGDGIATYGMGPWAMAPYVPTTVPSHEYGHGILIGMQGLNNTPYDGMWHEGWANFSEEQLANDIDPSNMIWNHSLFLPHGRDYYDSWVWWEHLRETPGYGPAFLSTLFTQCRGSQSEYVFDAMTRLDPASTADHQNNIKDLIGKYAAKNVTWDYERGDLMRGYSMIPNNIDPTNDNYRRAFTEAIREVGSNTVFRVPFDQAPSQGGFCVIPINVVGNTAGGFSVSVDFKPIADGIRQSDWRATLVAVNTNGGARYSSMWNCGVNTIVLSKDETKLYLVVAATPSFLGDTGRLFLYQPAVAPQAFEFSLVNTSATVYETAAMKSSSGLTQVANGKGYRSSTATVASTAYVGPNARVLGNAQVLGNARIEDDAVVQDSAVVKDNAVISGHAIISGSAQIYGNAKVRDWARVLDSAQVYENGRVLEHAHVGESACKVHGNATEKGQVWDGGSADVSGYAIKEGDCLNTANFDHGVLMCWVWGIDQAFADSQPDTAGVYCCYDFEKANPVYAMDKYGIIHGYLMGGASRVKINDSYRNNALSLDGASNYVELRNDVNDLRDTTIAMWVYWTGSAEDQRIFSFGDGSSKYMYLTPKDTSTKKLRLVVSNGTTVQYIDGTDPLTANRWTHIAVTFTGSAATYTAYVASPYAASSTKWTASATLYVDGTVVGTNNSILVPDQVSAANVLAGGNYNFLGKGSTGNFFQGYLDDFRVYALAQDSTVVATLAGQISNRSAGVVANTDTTAPTPSTAAWLVLPTLGSDGASITMSAAKGTDAGGNGVLYNFVCTAGGGHSSGWISSNKYTDNSLSAGTTYTYTVQMRDHLGNTGTVSSSASATTAATDTAPPVVSGTSSTTATFASAPKGISSTQISMVASTGSDPNGVEYLFTRVSGTGGSANSGWQASPNYVFTGTSNNSYTFSVQMRDRKGNVGTVSATSAAAIARDDSSPTVTSVARAVWQGRPYAKTNNTFWMRARTVSDPSSVRYYFHLAKINGVAQPDPSTYDSGWLTTNEWTSATSFADGTYTWQLKVRDNSTRQNTSAYMGTIDCIISPFTGYHNYTMSQLPTLPDNYLVNFSGTVVKVGTNSYTVKDSSSAVSISVRPNTNLEVTDTSLLFKNVTVKGHLYTYGGSRVVTTAVLTSNGSATLYAISGKVSNSGGTGISGATVYVSDAANASVAPIATATTDANGNYSISVPNGTWYVAAGAVNYYTSADQTVIVNGAAVPNTNFTLSSMPQISGRVTDVVGNPVSGVTVCFATQSGAEIGSPIYTATTDASGNYSRGVTNGTWYIAAYGTAYGVATERTVAMSGSPVSGIDFVVKAYTTPVPLVLLDPAALATGNLTTWNNDGSLGGSFGNEGTTVVVETVASKKCVTFDGGDRMKSTFTAPTGITGNSDWSVACWAYNPGIGGEECMVSWADRSGGSRDMQFNYGNAAGWGAATHMSNDLGWANAVAPTAGQWHYLVLTYAGGSNGLESVYVDGVLNNTAYKTLNLFTSEPVFLGCAFNSDLSTGWNFSGSLAGVRIIDGQLTASQVQDLYTHATVSTYSLSGTVTNVGGTGLAGATVYFCKSTSASAHPDATATTDANGAYSISLPNGTWYIAASKSGYITSGDISRTVSSAAITGANIQLTTGQSYTIAATAGTGGTISPVGNVSVVEGGSQAFTITPSLGYAIDYVTVDGVSQGIITSYTFNTVVANHTISATFKSDPYSDQLLYYKFDETSGTIAADTTGKGKNGTLNGGATWTAGKISNCISLDGSTGYVAVPNLGTQSNFTLTTWVYLNSLPTSGNVAEMYASDSWVSGALRCDIGNTGQISFQVNGWSVAASSTGLLTTGSWKHVALVFNGSTGSVYINGALDKSTSVGSTSAVLASARIGTWAGGARYLNGKLDDYHIYNRALSAADVQSLYNSGLTFTITASAGANGSITPSGTLTLGYGANQTFTIAPSLGFIISQVAVDGVNQGALSSYTFSNVTANHTISATFASVPTYTITASAGANGSISPSGAVVVTQSSNQTFTITPNPGYIIDTLTVDGATQASASSYTFSNVTANHTISVTFKADPYADMVAYLKFDETSGATASDTSGKGNNAALSGGYTWAAGKFNNAVSLDGTTGYASLPSGLLSTVNDFTISAWVNLTTNTTSNRLFDFGTGTSTYMYLSPNGAAGKVRYAIKYNGGTEQQIDGTSALSTSSWQYVVVTQSGNTGTLYINGVEVGQNTSMTLRPSDLGVTTQNWIGRSQSASQYFKGMIDDFRIYNRALSAAEIQDEFLADSPYTITASADPNGSINPTGVVSMNAGASQTFTITPNSGYAVTQVLVDGVDQGAITSYTFSNVTADHIISVSFSQISRTITASAGTGGSITPTGGVLVPYGGSQIFTIIPNPGYNIQNVLVDGMSMGSPSSYAFNNVLSNHTITAAFSVITYTITASAGTGGTITPSGPVVVNYGSTQVFNISPNTGYGISSVTVDGVNVGAQSTVTFTNIVASHTVSASFVRQYTITASAGTGGSISPTGSVLVNTGTNKTFTITANTGYSISQVTVDGVNRGAISTYTFSNVTANHTISASFTPIAFTIAASAGANGSITPSGNVTANYGSDSTFAITPDAHYQIADVLVDGISVGGVASYTFTNVIASHTISATFKPAAKPVGVGTRTVLIDPGIVGKLVKTWGRVSGKTGTTFLITDGYTGSVTVNIGTASLPIGFGDGSFAIVTGTVNADHTVTAVEILKY